MVKANRDRKNTIFNFKETLTSVDFQLNLTSVSNIVQVKIIRGCKFAVWICRGTGSEVVAFWSDEPSLFPHKCCLMHFAHMKPTKSCWCENM